MKRILYSSIFIASLLIANFAKAQTPNFFPTPQGQCSNPANVYTVNAAMVALIPGAVTYSWNVYTAAGCVSSFTTIPGGVPTHSIMNATILCCGVYTIEAIGYSGANVPILTITNTGTVFCPTGATYSYAAPVNATSPNATVQTLCVGENATLTPNGAASYTWNTGSNANPLVVNPSVNTCYTFTGTTSAANGSCAIVSAPICVSVQAASYTVTPASQTMCVGSPVAFTAAATPIFVNTTLGTTISGYQWYSPLNPPPTGPAFSTTPQATINAAPGGGTHSVVITHLGAAGTCTLQGNSTVVIGAAIPVSITPTSPSVCPGGSITLTANSIQSAPGQFTWTSNAGGPNAIHPSHNKAVTFNGVQPVTSVTVDVDYFGCPGQATVDIGLLSLTPTLVASASLTCPGQTLSLMASGATNYTFYGTPGGSTGTPTLVVPGIPTPTSTTPSVVVTPQAGNFPIQYCVNTESAGCVGSTCIIVDERILTPSLTVSGTGSLCPGTSFTLTAAGSGVGAGSTYSFSSDYSASISATANIAHPTPPFTSIPPSNSYTVVVDSAGCRGTASNTVYVLTLTPTLSSSSPSICAGQQLTLTSSGGDLTTYTFTASHPQFSNSLTVIATSTVSSVTHTPPGGANPPPVLNYTVQVDSAGCKGMATHSVGILDLGPTLTLTTLPLSGSVCPGTSVTINAHGSLNYTFTAPAPLGVFHTATTSASSNTISGIAATPTLFPPAGVVYTVQADSSSCVGSKTITVFEYKLNPQISVSPTLVCSLQEVTVTASGVGTGTDVVFQFYSLVPPGTTPSTIQSSIGSFSTTHNPTLQTIYSVVVDSAGCTSIIPPPTATVDVRPDLQIIPSASSTSVCPGLTSTLSVTGPVGATSISFTWSQPANGGSITPNPAANVSSVVVNPILNTTYTITALDSLGCVGDTIIDIGIDPSLSFPISLSSSGSTICPGQSVTLTATSTVSTIGNITYTWSPLTGIIPNVQPTPSVIGSPSVTTVYTVTADNGFGCVAQNTINLPVSNFPTVTPVPSHFSVCTGFTSTITAFGAGSYTWTGSTFTNAIVQQSISVGSGSYMVVGSNGGGCTSQTVITIGHLGPLQLNIVASPGSQTTCITKNSPTKVSKPVHLTASGAGTYVWFPYSPPIMTYSIGPQTDVRPPATMQFTVIGTTAICSGTAAITISVIPQFSASVTPPLPALCVGDSLKLSVVNVSTVNSVAPYDYIWGEALNAPPISMTNYYGSTVSVFPQNTTTYTLEVKDARECISLPRLVTVTVLPQPVTAIAIPTINNVATNTVCFVGLNPGPLDITLNLTALNQNTGLQFGVVPTYTWISPYMPTYNTILSPPNGNMVTINAPIRVLNNSAVSVYTVISGYNGVAGCKRMDTVSVRVVDCRPAYTATFTTAEPNDTICSRTCITYVNQADTMSGGPQTYTWSFEGGSPKTSNEKNPTVCYNFPSVLRPYNVILTVSNPYPLSSSGGSGSTAHAAAPSYVRVVDVPNVTIVSPGQLKSDTTIRFGKSVNLKGSGALTYEWSPAYNITSITKPGVTVNPFKTTQYILTGYNSKLCSSSDTINVIVIEDCGEMYVPNAFTPNNDGTNDVLYVRGICLQSLTFMVFNRWGEKVFETADQNIGWDGKYKGEELNTGVFVFRLEGKTYDGKGFSSKGNITLIR